MGEEGWERRDGREGMGERGMVGGMKGAREGGKEGQKGGREGGTRREKRKAQREGWREIEQWYATSLIDST